MSMFLVPPTILPGLTLLGSAPGVDVTIECIVESYPAAFIVWSIEGNSQIKPNSQFGAKPAVLSTTREQKIEQLIENKTIYYYMYTYS